MERVSQLILRNAERLNQGNILLINPPRDSCYSQLAENGYKVSIFTQDFGDWKWLQDSGADAQFGTFPSVSPQTDHIILIQARERERLLMMLHALATAMPAAAGLWLVGENRSGIKSSGKRLSLYFENVCKSDNARHCALFSADQPRPVETFSLSDYEKPWSVSTAAGNMDIISLPGTFAHGNLDKGSELLLDTLLELAPSGRVLDFACGSGVIGLSLLGLNPEIDLTMLDTSALAIESTRRSLAKNHQQATVVASDGLAELTGKYDWIISNPPFHRGVENDPGIAHDFFSEAGHFLQKEGKILLVCNQHLPYPAWLKAYFTKVETVRAKRGFKVILASGIRR